MLLRVTPAHIPSFCFNERLSPHQDHNIILENRFARQIRIPDNHSGHRINFPNPIVVPAMRHTIIVALFLIRSPIAV